MNLSFLANFVEKDIVNAIGIFFILVFSAVSSAINFESVEGKNWSPMNEESLFESLVLPDENASTENNQSSENSPSETTENESNLLNPKLVEQVGDPSAIDRFEKDLYIEETLLGEDSDKNSDNENKKENKKTQIESAFDFSSVSEVLALPDPLAESDPLLDENSRQTWDDAFSLEEAPL